MSFRRLLFVAAALLSLPLSAQQPRASEAIEVRLLEVDVVVTDKDGKPVHGLTAADFELYENGRLQQVTNLSEYREADAARPASAGLEVSRPPAAPAPARPEPRTIVLLFDPIALRGPARVDFFAAIHSLLDRSLRPGDRVQMLTWTGSGFRTNLAPDPSRQQVLDVVSKMGTSPTAVMPEGTSVEQIELFFRSVAEAMDAEFDPADLATEKRHRAEEEFAAMKRKTASMQRIVASLTNTEGKAVVIYVSEQFSRIAGKGAFLGSRSSGGPPAADEATYDTTKMVEAVVDTANANGVAFHTLRPVIPSTFGQMRTREEEIAIAENITAGTEWMTDHLMLQNQIEALTHLSDSTGGTFGVGPEGVRTALERIATDLTAYYSLGWRARSDGTDRERRVRVKAKNPDYKVRTRASLVEKSDKTRGEDLLVARLFERGSAGEIEFDVKAGESQPSRGQTRSIPVTLTIPVDQLKFVPEGGVSAATFTVLTVAGPSIGQTTKITRDTRKVTAADSESIRDGVVRYDFTLLSGPGRSAVSIGVFDESSGLIGVRTIDLDGGTAAVAAVTSPASDAIWRTAFERSVAERKPLVVFFRPKRCRECDVFERQIVVHPAIARRMPSVTYVAVPVVAGSDSQLWQSKDEGIAVFDETATLRARWVGVPDTTQLGEILDAAIASAPNFQRAAQLTADSPWTGASEAAIGLAKLGRTKEARELLTEASEKAGGEAQQLAAVTLATLDAREGRPDQALAALGRLALDARTPRVAAEAMLASGLIQRARGAAADARRAFLTAIESAEPGSQVHATASAQLAELQAVSRPAAGAIRLVPLPAPPVRGRQRVRTTVTSPAVAKVEFTLDGEKASTVTSPPFAAELHFGDVPQTRTLRVVAFDVNGAEVGRDEIRVNDAGEVFWLRVAEPAAGPASGRVKVSLDLRAPSGRQVKRIAFTWNDAPAGAISAAPWTAFVDVPNEIGVLRAVAELDDGRTAEDAVLLNASGAGERAEVQLVELPVSVQPRKAFTTNDVIVREGRTKRTVESVTPAGEAPLTVGLLIDWSASMRTLLPDVQEAALRFLESVLGPSDRAFVMAFHSEGRLLQPPTSDLELLRRTIMSLQLQPQAPTAVHDAMILGLLQFEGVRGRRALIMFTDGLDQGSRYDADDLTAMSRRSNVPVYIVTPPLPTIATVRETVATPTVRPDSQPGAARPPTMTSIVVRKLEPRAQKLYEVAEASGGRLHEVGKLGALGKIYESIGEALEAQALVIIRTDPATKENEWRTIGVDINGAEVRAPAGYFVPR